MIYNQKELIILACAEQINILSRFYDPNHPSRGRLIEKFNAHGHTELDFDYTLVNFIEELEDIQDDPETVLQASWFNREALIMLLEQLFEKNLLKLLGSEEAHDNLLVNLKRIERAGDVNTIPGLN